MVIKAIRVDEKKWAELSALAKEKGTTAAALVREAVYEMVKARKVKG